MLTDDEVVALLKGETIGPFSDFRSKKGKLFTASVRLTDNKIDFMFADSNADLDIDAIKKGYPSGHITGRRHQSIWRTDGFHV